MVKNNGRANLFFDTNALPIYWSIIYGDNLISIHDRRNIILDAIKYNERLKSLKEHDRMHAEKRARDLKSETKVRENREQALIDHEKNNLENAKAREKEVEAHQEFLKSSLRIL